VRFDYPKHKRRFFFRLGNEPRSKAPADKKRARKAQKLARKANRSK